MVCVAHGCIRLNQIDGYMYTVMEQPAPTMHVHEIVCPCNSVHSLAFAWAFPEGKSDRMIDERQR